MLNFRIAATLSGPRVGPTLATTEDEDYLANLACRPGGTNDAHRLWGGARGHMTPNASTGLAEWRDRIRPGDVLAGVAATSLPTRTEAWTDSAGKAFPTLTFAGASELDAVAAALDTLRNTVYILCRPTSGVAGLQHCFGPAASPTAGAPTDDILAFGWVDGVPRLFTDAGNASLLIGSGDRRGLVTLFRVTMSPEYGKAIHVNGVQNARNANLVSGVTETRYSVGNFGAGPTGPRLRADVGAVLVLPGQDHTDPYFADADARITSIMKGWGAIA